MLITLPPTVNRLACVLLDGIRKKSSDVVQLVLLPWFDDGAIAIVKDVQLTYNFRHTCNFMTSIFDTPANSRHEVVNL